MHRRTFFKLTGAASAVLGIPALVATGRAQEDSYGGPYWVFVTASGGWDPRFMFDPVLNTDQNRLYTEIAQIGEISYAPIAIDQEALGLGTDEDLSPYLLDNEGFLTRFGSRLLVLNGVDAATNNHETGQRGALSGQNPTGYPALPALIAATHAPEQPVTFMSSGGYDFTDGHVPMARVSDPGALRDLAYPNLIAPENEDTDSFHTSSTWSRIRAAQRARLGTLREQYQLPRYQTSFARLEAARATDNLLARLQVPDELIDLPGNLGDLERFERAVQIAVSGFSAGVAVSATLQLGGFDTHGNHDRDQVRQIVKLWGGLGYLFDQLDAAGVGDKTYVVVTSDFARGPHYNSDGSNAGKDHWPITSMLLAGPGIEGNRVVGATNADQLPRRVDPSSLAVGDGVRLTPPRIHGALRSLAQVSTKLDEQYPLAEEPLPLFG